MTTPKKPIGPPPDALASWVSPSLPTDERDAFWQRVMDYESAPTTTDFQRLLDAGVELPEPDTLNDQQITTKLWEVIRALADLSVFLVFTDHLGDRALYELLWRDRLREEDADLPGVSTTIDIVGSSEEDMQVYLKYFADEATRRDWLADFPDDILPPHEDPPFDRDRLLPTPYAD